MNNLFPHVCISSYPSIKRYSNIDHSFLYSFTLGSCCFKDLSTFFLSVLWDLYLFTFLFYLLYLEPERPFLPLQNNFQHQRVNTKIEKGSFISVCSSNSMFFLSKGLPGLKKMDVTENTFTKKRNSGGIPNNETIPWKHFCSEICKVWLLEDPKAIAVAEKTHFSAWIFFTKFPRLLDAILHNLHKLNQSMLNLGQFFAELKISTTKNGKRSQTKNH